MRLGPGTQPSSSRRGHSLRYQLGSSREGSESAGRTLGTHRVPNSPRVAWQVLESLGLQCDRLLQALQRELAGRDLQLLFLTGGTRVWWGKENWLAKGPLCHPPGHRDIKPVSQYMQQLGT